MFCNRIHLANQLPIHSVLKFFCIVDLVVFQSSSTENNVVFYFFQTPVYMSTTVPQSIKGINIMGRHKPTRTSLRHSRMIVINKNFQSQHKNSLNIKCAILARIFLILQIIIGVALVTMGLYLLVWAPHTRIKDNPYWSGIMLVLSGILGLYLLSYKRTPLHRLKENFFMFVKVRKRQ
jgi:hypothetical protein